MGSGVKIKSSSEDARMQEVGKKHVCYLNTVFNINPCCKKLLDISLNKNNQKKNVNCDKDTGKPFKEHVPHHFTCAKRMTWQTM